MSFSLCPTIFFIFEADSFFKRRILVINVCLIECKLPEVLYSERILSKDFMDETLNILVILIAISQKRERKNTNLKIENIEILEKREEYGWRYL